jgi:hypothetical protein
MVARMFYLNNPFINTFINRMFGPDRKIHHEPHGSDMPQS